MSPEHLETIYVALLDQPQPSWRPVHALRRAHGVFLIASRNDDPELEQWEFPSGSLVRCEERELSGGRCLVAIQAVRPHDLKLV